MQKTMKHIYTLAATISLAMGATTTLAQQTIVLKFSHFTTSNSNFVTGVAEPWCAAIEKDSGGKLKCQMYPSMQLGGTAAQLADQVKNGVADVVWTSPSYTTGRFPRTEALELPFSLPPSSLGGSRAMWEYTEKYGKEDFKDFKLLTLFSASNVVISTANKPILSPDDLKGVKLRSPSRFSSLFLTALGGTPVTMPTPAITEAISKGVIDGAMAPWEILPTVKADEVTKYHMEGAPSQPGFTQTPMAMLMNKNKYESLPNDLKAVIDKNSGAVLTEMAARTWDKGNEEARKKLTATGHKTLTIKDADYNAMKKSTASVETDWIKQATAKGLDGIKLAAEVHALGNKYLSK